MPFAPLGPSLQLGLLKAEACAEGFPTRTFHLNLNLASRIGITEYEGLAEHRGVNLGDWLFSVAAFEDFAPDAEGRFIDDFADELTDLLHEIKRTPAWLKHLRDVVVPSYLDEVLETSHWDELRVVGFTSTFQQNTASFALARRLKMHNPSVIMVFGGANFDGEMGAAWLSVVPWVDYVVVGEGDTSFPGFLIALAEGHDPAEVPGIMSRRNGNAAQPQTNPLLRDLDELPFADFDEYFARTKECFPASQRLKAIPFESSRGCWWGVKQHCTFCGLNGATMAYRSKSPQRLLEELEYYSSRYSIMRFEAVDNILDHRYLRSFLPALLERGSEFRFFYEIKANLSREDIRLLHAAGVDSLQPGIESLNTHILKLMRKGITTIQNVNTLRWCRFYDIYVSWSLLHGFPGERREDYDEQNDLVRSLVHLQPPIAVSRIWIERFSPMFITYNSSPIKRLRPEASYAYVYPKSADLERAAYFFEGELGDTVSDEVLGPLVHAVDHWRESWLGTEKPTFTFSTCPSGLILQDHRIARHQKTAVLNGLAASIYAYASERPQTARGIGEHLGAGSCQETVREALDELTRNGWMMREGDLFLSLALPEEDELR